MRSVAARVGIGGVLALLPMLAAAAGCDVASPGPAVVVPLSRQHHPVDRPLPSSPGFNNPRDCDDGFWYFDQNGNGRADASEPRLFGRDRQLACASCHSGEGTASGPAAAVFLRQSAATLCLVCHRL